MRPPGAKYVAFPTWDGQQWQVRVEDDDDEYRGDTSGGRLDEVPDSVRVFLAGQLGVYIPDMPVWVEPQLPDQVEHALQHAEGLVRHAAKEVDTVVAALLQAGMFGHDIAALLAERSLQDLPQRPLLIPNSEIAAHGLAHRPDVIAVQWPDTDVVLTCCRTCIETNRRPWQNEPDGTSAAIYEERTVRCDICGHSGEATAREMDARPPGREH